MATTNRVYLWKDGDRLFVGLNGATIEAQALTFERDLVTLQFRGSVAALRSAADGEPAGVEPAATWRRQSRAMTVAANDFRTTARNRHGNDPLLDECLWRREW